MRLPKPNDTVPDAIPRGMLSKRRAALAHVTNPAGGSAPPLTIWKRKEPPAMASFSDLIASADALIRKGDSHSLEAANDALERANRMIDKHSVHVHNYANDLDDEDDDDEDDEDNNSFDSPSETSMEKWSTDCGYHGFGGTPGPEQPTSTMRGPTHRPDTYNQSITPTAGMPPLRTKFESRIDYIQDRDKCARSDAQRKARVEFPQDYTTYQQLNAELPTNQQHLRRYPVGAATKRAPASFEDLVSNEMLRKGVNYELAMQRVCQQYGYPAFNNRAMSTLAKGQDIETRFRRIAKRIADEEGLPLEEATRKARLRNQSLFKALQSL
jgi:hypothetical protein